MLKFLLRKNYKAIFYNKLVSRRGPFKKGSVLSSPTMAFALYLSHCQRFTHWKDHLRGLARYGHHMLATCLLFLDI